MRGKSRSYLLKVVGAIGVLLLANNSSMLFAQAPVPVPVTVPGMAVNQLDGLVAPIALYPDPLLSQMLVAATFPLQLVAANQWLQQNPGLSGPALTQAAQAQNWDPSVQALVMFPDVLKRLTDDINWTTNLGNVFLAQQADVMSAIQRMRVSAEQSGKLASTPQQQVVTTTEGGQPTVVINPANPEVIYVPDYDPSWVWGPAAYYPYPRWYYPRRSGFFFGIGISIGGFLGGGWGGWGGWGWHPGWGARTVIVNNTFIRRNNFNTARFGFNSARFGNGIGRSGWNGGGFGRQGFANPAPMARSFAPSRPAAPLARSFAPSRPAAPMARSFAPSRSAPAQSFRAAPAQRMASPRQAAPNFSSQSQGSFRSAAPMARSAAPSSRSQSSSRGGGSHGGGHSSSRR